MKHGWIPFALGFNHLWVENNAPWPRHGHIAASESLLTETMNHGLIMEILAGFVGSSMSDQPVISETFAIGTHRIMLLEIEWNVRGRARIGWWLWLWNFGRHYASFNLLVPGHRVLRPPFPIRLESLHRATARYAV